MTEARKLALGYAALLALLMLTVASSFFDLGGFNSAVNLAIAAVKAALIAVQRVVAGLRRRCPP